MNFMQNRLLLALASLCFNNSLVSAFKNGTDKIRGVNIGGWLVIEPWITPSLFDQFYNNTPETTAVDEYTFTKYLGKEEARRQLEAHWSSFVTENDFKRIRDSGINYVRIPIGYWIFGALPNEPWVSGSLSYLLKGIEWAKKYNLKVIVDLHCAPGSQNGFDNSGRLGPAEWFKDEASIYRVKDILVLLALMFKQPDYLNTVTAIELINEPASWKISVPRLLQFYNETYHSIRELNKDLTLVMSDAFILDSTWDYLGFHPYQKVLLDTHIYQIFTPQHIRMTPVQHMNYPCTRIASLNRTNSIVPTFIGEWTLATDDCALWLNGFKRGSRYEGTHEISTPACPGCNCTYKNDASTYDNEYMKKYAMRQISIYEQYGQGWFFWNFKTERAPNWDFLLAVEKGWIDLSLPQVHEC